MPRYDASDYHPPAPVAEVSLRSSGGGGPTISNIHLLIDTGADVTLLPRSAVLRLGVQPAPGAGYELVGFDGTRTTADAVELEMIFLNKSFRGRYLLIDADRGILGRDVLAALALRAKAGMVGGVGEEPPRAGGRDDDEVVILRVLKWPRVIRKDAKDGRWRT